MYLLFTAKSCPNCPKEKERLKQNGVDFIEIDVSTDEGLFKAYEFNVMNVPRLIKTP